MASREETLRALRVRRMIMDMTGQRSRRRKKPPAQRFPSGARLEYLRSVLAIQRQIEDAVKEIVFPNLEELVVQSRIERPDDQRTVFDAVIDTITKMVGDVQVSLGQSLEVVELDMLAGRTAQSIAGHNARETTRIIQSTIGIDAITAEPWMASVQTAFRKENVNLIESLVGDELKQIENVLIRGQRGGVRVEVLREQIEKRFKVSRNKASLLARDQTNKLNGELTGLRQTALGIQEYIWRDSNDGNVRDSHAELDGTKQRWDDPPVTNDAGDRNHPGGDYQCRCFAEPVVDPLLDATEPIPTGAPLRIPRISPGVSV